MIQLEIQGTPENYTFNYGQEKLTKEQQIAIANFALTFYDHVRLGIAEVADRLLICDMYYEHNGRWNILTGYQIEENFYETQYSDYVQEYISITII